MRSRIIYQPVAHQISRKQVLKVYIRTIENFKMQVLPPQCRDVAPNPKLPVDILIGLRRTNYIHRYR